MGLWDTAPSFNNPPSFNDLESVQKYLKDNINKIARSLQEIDFVINGNMDSRNTREIGGYNVDLTELKSKNGTVGISSFNDPDPSVDDVRFWAGNVDKNAAPWKVTEAGKMYATGAVIQSSSGYPKVVIDPDGKLIAAYFSATEYMEIQADYAGAPSFNLIHDGNVVGRIDMIIGYPEFYGKGGLDFLTDNNGNINLKPGGSGLVTLASWYKLYNEDSGRTLGEDLSEIFDRLEAGGL